MERVSEGCAASDCCSLYDSDISQDWYSPSYSPPDHAYTPTGDVVDDVTEGYPSDYDYNYDYDDHDDWRYDNRPRGTGRKLPAPPPNTDYAWQTPTPTVNGDYMAPATDGGLTGYTGTQQGRPADTAPPANGYTDVVHRDYADYNGYYDTVDDYYDGSDGYDRTSEMYDDRYYMSFDAEYADGLVNGYADEYKYVHGSETDGHQPYYDYSGKSYDAAFQQYSGTERGTDTDQQSTQYQLPSSLSPAVAVGDVAHDAIYDDGYVDRDGVYHHYNDDRYYDGVVGRAKYVGSIPSDAGESAYDADELAEEVLSSVPARSSIDSSATPAALRYDRYYDGKTDSFESYDRDSTAYDAAAAAAGAMKDSGYQTFNQQQSLPSEPEPPYFNHVYVSGWPPAAVNADALRSPVTIIDAQVPRQSFHISHPADSSFMPSADQRWPVSSPPATYSDGLPSASVPAGFCDTLMPTSAVEPTTIGY